MRIGKKGGEMNGWEDPFLVWGFWYFKTPMLNFQEHFAIHARQDGIKCGDTLSLFEV